MTVRSGILLGIVLATVTSCSGEDGPPGGGGIRLVFSDEMRSSGPVRVTLLDADQSYPQWGCEAQARRLSPALHPDSVGGGCDSMAIVVFNLIGKPVFHRTLDSFQGAAWDGRDDNGNPAPDGYYILHFRCLGPDAFEINHGLYLLHEPGCEWPLWSEVVETVVRGELEFAPFPVWIEMPVTDPGSPDVIGTIVFESPLRIRVEVPGMPIFEENVILIEGKYTEVNVRLIP